MILLHKTQYRYDFIEFGIEGQSLNKQNIDKCSDFL